MSEETESFAPAQMQRLASSVPWTLVALVLIYGGLAGDEAKDKIIGFGGAALAMVVSFRAAKMRLVLDGDEVLIVGWLKARRIPWSDVDRFVLNTKGLAVKTRGGIEESVPAFAMGGWILKSIRNSMQADLQQTLEKAERYRRRVRRER
ncbi:MAG: hypothetical protein ACT4QG_04190 [Sporichthyaceae bacterium]